MAEMPTPTVMHGEQSFAKLCQVTVRGDDEIAAVNRLLSEGWRLVSIGHRADVSVYVLGRDDGKPRRSTGFLPGD